MITAPHPPPLPWAQPAPRDPTAHPNRAGGDRRASEQADGAEPTRSPPEGFRGVRAQPGPLPHRGQPRGDLGTFASAQVCCCNAALPSCHVGGWLMPRPPPGPRFVSAVWRPLRSLWCWLCYPDPTSHPLHAFPSSPASTCARVGATWGGVCVRRPVALGVRLACPGQGMFPVGSRETVSVPAAPGRVRHPVQLGLWSGICQMCLGQWV